MIAWRVNILVLSINCELINCNNEEPRNKKAPKPIIISLRVILVFKRKQFKTRPHHWNVLAVQHYMYKEPAHQKSILTDQTIYTVIMCSYILMKTIQLFTLFNNVN